MLASQIAWTKQLALGSVRDLVPKSKVGELDTVVHALNPRTWEDFRPARNAW